MKPEPRHRPDLRPLVLLDVDGVINDIGYLRGEVTDTGHSVIVSHGFVVAVPPYMPVLIQWLCSVAEVHWCTTWRHRANDDIAAHLGIPALPVVDDGTDDRYVGWKAAAAHDLAAAALAEGRRVLWVEDFYDELPDDEMPHGVEFVDTASDEGVGPVLTVEMIPEWLWALAAPRRTRSGSSSGSSSDSSSASPKAA